jgi:hypothetical protein
MVGLAAETLSRCYAFSVAAGNPASPSGLCHQTLAGKSLSALSLPDSHIAYTSQ